MLINIRKTTSHLSKIFLIITTVLHFTIFTNVYGQFNLTVTLNHLLIIVLN